MFDEAISECTLTGACDCAVRDGGAGVRCRRFGHLCGFPGLDSRDVTWVPQATVRDFKFHILCTCAATMSN